MLYLKRPQAKNWELRRCVGALQIQRLEGSRPWGLWDLFLDEAVVAVCEMALAVGALPFQLLVAERIVGGRQVRRSGAPHHTAFWRVGDREPVCAPKHEQDSRLEMWIHEAHRLR